MNFPVTPLQSRQPPTEVWQQAGGGGNPVKPVQLCAGAPVPAERPIGSRCQKSNLGIPQLSGSAEVTGCL